MAVVGLIAAFLIVGDTKGASPATQQPRGSRQITPTLRVDFDQRVVILDAHVVFRDGPLELLLCPIGTKEHESVLAADIEPKTFQLALLLVGANPGRPARFETRRADDGSFVNRVDPPEGQKIKVWVQWRDKGRLRFTDGRNWVRDIHSNRPLAADFVFAGSGFARLPGVDRPVFLGNDGDLVCVANFPGAIVDVAVRSSPDNSERLFEANTERIPPLGTRVQVIFEPLGD
jgi:hypothetical protein